MLVCLKRMQVLWFVLTTQIEVRKGVSKSNVLQVRCRYGALHNY